MKCPKCSAAAKPTNWQPPAGANPKLKEYICIDGKHRFYATRGKAPKNQGWQADFWGKAK